LAQNITFSETIPFKPGISDTQTTVSLKNNKLNENQKSFNVLGDDGITFLDFLDIINPLQHIPVISTLYRKITGDKIDPASKFAGSAIYGGPLGAIASAIDLLVEYNTGKDIGEHVLNSAGSNNTKNKAPTQVSSANEINFLSITRTNSYHLKNSFVGDLLTDNFKTKRDNHNYLLQKILIDQIESRVNIKALKNHKSKENMLGESVTSAYNKTSLL